MAKGWLKIPGVQDGDRTLAQQILALQPAIAKCRGKTVLDLGCAEGLIGREFAKAGAATVVGIEREGNYVSMARAMCLGYRVSIKHADVKDLDPEFPMPHDIVLALGIIHKLEHPEMGLRFAARSARELLLLRSGRGSVNGIIRGKFSRNECDSAKLMTEEGFVLERVIEGPPELKEPCEYWRRP